MQLYVSAWRRGLIVFGGSDCDGSGLCFVCCIDVLHRRWTASGSGLALTTSGSSGSGLMLTASGSGLISLLRNGAE